MKIRSWLLNPVVLYGVIFGGYIAIPTISATYFDEYTQLFLGSVWDFSIVQRGLLVFLISLAAFYFGYRGSMFFSNYTILPLTNYRSAQTVVRWSLVPLALLAVSLMGPGYLSSQYEGVIDPEGFYHVSDSVRAGVTILYFTVEILVSFLLIADWNYRGRIKPLTILAVTVVVVVAAGGMKRLELMTPILGFFGFVYLNRSKALYTPAILLVLFIAVLAGIGTYRLGLGFGLASLASIPLEANFVVNSLYRVIDLVDNNGYPFTHAVELLAIPISVIPNLLFPDKYLVLDIDPLWSDRLEVSPLGGYYGLAHLYRYGGTLAVGIFSLLLGLLLGYLYRRFLRSFDGSRFASIFYPVIIMPFLFHYVRDDITVAIKLLLQTAILLYVLSEAERLIRNASNKAKQEQYMERRNENSRTN